MTTLNSTGASHMYALIGAGKVDKTTAWSFSAADGNDMLGANGKAWAEYGRWHLAIHGDAPENTKERYGYPFGKHGKVYRSAIIAIKQRAAQQGDSAIEASASTALEKIDAKKGMETMHRAYSVFEVKSADDKSGLIEGIASTINTDRQGDIMEPKGAVFSLPMPLLWQHDAKSPIGHVIAASVTDAGIKIKAQIARGVLPEIDRAWALIKAGLVRGLSIGFHGLEAESIKAGSGGINIGGGTRYKRWSWLELSTVTIPANSEANITTIKNIDVQTVASMAAGAMLPERELARLQRSFTARAAKGLPVVRLK
jgi:HK97 family phage prohead protease